MTLLLVPPFHHLPLFTSPSTVLQDKREKRLINVKIGKLEPNLDLGTCCSRKLHWKSNTMFVQEAHLSTVKSSKINCLTLLGHSSGSNVASAKVGGWDNLEHYLFENVVTIPLHRNHGNTSNKLLLDPRLF